MHQQADTRHPIERVIAKRQARSIAPEKLDVREPAMRHGQHRRGEVTSRDAKSLLEQQSRDAAGATGDVEDSTLASQSSHGPHNGALLQQPVRSPL
jgi:hypothetical protein